MSRREKIEAMLADDPQDNFLRYALANEYEAEERFEESLALFSSLRKEPQPHVPTFLRSAQVLVRLGRIDEARGVLREGIEIARSVGASHPAAEMSELLASLGSMGE